MILLTLDRGGSLTLQQASSSATLLTVGDALWLSGRNRSQTSQGVATDAIVDGDGFSTAQCRWTCRIPPRHFWTPPQLRYWEPHYRMIVQFSCSVVSNSCSPMDCNTPGLPVHHHLLEFAQTHVHWVGDAIQPSLPLSSPSPPVFNLFQHQGLFQWVLSSHQVATILATL